MAVSSDRRAFLSASTVGLGALAAMDRLPRVSAADAKVDPKLVRLDSGIEPLVKLLEETPRDRLLEEVGGRVKKGLAYRDVLAALLLAGVRNIQPRPAVGFKFHAVLAVNAAHQASLAGPDRDRWLPIFWALDNFKGGQAQNLKETGWRMKPVDESNVPAARNALKLFAEAMETWDEAKADVAAAGVARHCTEGQAFDAFAKYGCRDYRDIGHKIIFVSNAFRTLQTIGWHHAEPVLRSLALALLKREGNSKPTGDLPADRVGIHSAELASKLGPDWRDGPAKPDSVPDLLAVLRQGSDADVGAAFAKRMDGTVSPRTLWDAVFLGAGELLMKQPGIVGLHTLTTANALRYAYGAVGDGEGTLRRVLLLQAASFLPLFRGAMGAKVANVRIDKLAADGDSDSSEAVFAALAKDRTKAAKMALKLMADRPDASRELIDAGRRLIFLKGTDSHDYKFSSAVLEDFEHISEPWRDRFLAASLHWMKGSTVPDSALVRRTREAMA
jgi:hypothetical protein